MTLLPSDILDLKVVFLDSTYRWVFLAMKLNGVSQGVIRFACEQDPATFASTFAYGNTFTFGRDLTFGPTFTCARMLNDIDPNAYRIMLRHDGVLQARSADTSRIPGDEPNFDLARFP